MRVSALVTVLAVGAGVFPAPAAERAFPAHRVAGNLYYVGSEGLACYLVATPAGHILINTGLEETVPLIEASVAKLGFRFRDIRIVLISHAHFDHCEGVATVRSKTGARVEVMAGDADVVESGGKGQVFSDHGWKPVQVDRVLHDGDKVELGGAVLTARLTPGHTKGCTTWTTTVRENGRDYRVVIVGSLNVNPDYKLVGDRDYPEIAADFEKTFRVLKALPCDIFLGAHGSYYGMEKKYARLREGGVNPFVDPDGYREFVERGEKAFHAKLKEQSGR